MTRLKKQLIRHEGMRLKHYMDTVGKLTIGVGRNLDDVGITQEEALFLLDTDVKKATYEAYKNWPWMVHMNQARKDVLINMTFNMGVPRLSYFKKFLFYARERDYEMAAAEMLDSLWAKQVGYRAEELAEQMRTGEYQRND